MSPALSKTRTVDQPKQEEHTFTIRPEIDLKFGSGSSLIARTARVCDSEQGISKIGPDKELAELSESGALAARGPKLVQLLRAVLEQETSNLRRCDGSFSMTKVDACCDILARLNSTEAQDLLCDIAEGRVGPTVSGVTKLAVIGRVLARILSDELTKPFLKKVLVLEMITTGVALLDHTALIMPVIVSVAFLITSARLLVDKVNETKDVFGQLGGLSDPTTIQAAAYRRLAEIGCVTRLGKIKSKLHDALK